MNERRSVEEVTNGLDTKSDKIRALARAGYLRTEISELLGIRYQHVRKVLVDAGITEGLQRQIEVERSPVLIEAPPGPREQTSWETLLRAGFRFLGEWVQSHPATLPWMPRHRASRVFMPSSWTTWSCMSA
jgi:hypothetical protein